MPNNVAAFNAEAWSKRVLTRLDQINVMLPLVSRDYEGEIKGVGSTVQVRTFGNVAVGPYTKGMTLSYSSLAPAKESMTVDDAQHFAFEIDDLDSVTTDLNVLDGYADRAAVAINDKVEEKCLSNYASALAANKLSNGGSAYTLSTSNAYTLFVDAGKALTDAKAPRTDRWAVIGPNWESLLLKDTTYFLRATDMADAVIRSGRLERSALNTPGFIGRVAGFNVYCSTAIPTDASGAYCQFGSGSVINYAGLLDSLERIRRETTFATAIRGLLFHGTKVFAEPSKAFGYWYVNAA